MSKFQTHPSLHPPPPSLYSLTPFHPLIQPPLSSGSWGKVHPKGEISLHGKVLAEGVREGGFIQSGWGHLNVVGCVSMCVFWREKKKSSGWAVREKESMCVCGRFTGSEVPHPHLSRFTAPSVCSEVTAQMLVSSWFTAAYWGFRLLRERRKKMAAVFNIFHILDQLFYLRMSSVDWFLTCNSKLRGR